jgi:hypothetical protein
MEKTSSELYSICGGFDDEDNERVHNTVPHTAIARMSRGDRVSGLRCETHQLVEQYLSCQLHVK